MRVDLSDPFNPSNELSTGVEDAEDPIAIDNEQTEEIGSYDSDNYVVDKKGQDEDEKRLRSTGVQDFRCVMTHCKTTTKQSEPRKRRREKTISAEDQGSLIDELLQFIDEANEPFCFTCGQTFSTNLKKL